MKIPSVANNSIKLLSGLANNDDSLTAMVVKDWIGDGATVYTYKKEGGKDDAREKAIEEFGTGAIWLFAIPAIKKIIECAIYPIFKLNPKFDPRILDDKANLEKIAKLASESEKTIFESLDKANPVLKKITNAQAYKGFAVGKFLIATGLSGFALTKIIKFKQKTTADRIAKEHQQDTFKHHDTLLSKSVDKNKTFESFTSKKQSKQVSFTGGLAEFMYNPIKNTFILDGVIAGTRLKEARKEERGEILFKEACQVGFVYGLAKPIQIAFEKLGNKFNCPIELDPKNLFDKNLKENLNASKESIETLKNSSDMLETLAKMDINNPLIGLLENEGVISLTKDKKAISMFQPINKKDIDNALNNFEKLTDDKNIKNLSKIKGFKTFAVIANVLIAAGIMGVIQPKLTIALRKLFFGTNENPAIAQQEKQAKLKNQQA